MSQASSTMWRSARQDYWAAKREFHAAIDRAIKGIAEIKASAATPSPMGLRWRLGAWMRGAW